MKRILLVFVFITMVYHMAIAQCNGYTTLDGGNSHSLALRADGTLWAWGYNDNGQLGDGTNANKNIPTQIGADTWKAVAGGTMHSLAIKSDGTLWAWGYNAINQLGDGTDVSKNAPTLIDGGNWKSVSAGESHSLAIKSDGTLWGWGRDYEGQLGHAGGNSNNKPTPVKIGTATWSVVEASGYTSYGIQSDGTLWAWGYGYSYIPTQIGADTWKTIAHGNGFTVGIKSNGTLWSWGVNGNGVLGLGEDPSYENYVPRQIGTDSWKAVAAGDRHSLAIKQDGTLWGWGYNADYRLGYEASYDDQYVPVQIGTAQWKAISIGIRAAHNLGIQQDGSLWAWGNNYYGQAGNGTSFNGLTSPTLIYAPGYNTTLAASGSSFTTTGNPMYAIYNSGCNPIAAIQQSKNAYNGITGSVTAKVWVASGQPAQYVKRHYEITPSENAATASAWVTLYFTQEEFDEFNTVNTLKLPIGPADAEGYKANLLIEKRSGTSSDNTGLPGTYSGSIETINPNDADIVWNAAAGRWEVTFEVTGFSGFFVKTQADVLPVTFGDISAYIKGGSLLVNFTSLTEENNDRFIIEASADGKNFTEIGTLKSTAKEGNSDIAIQYSFSLNTNSLGIAGMAGFGLFTLLCFAARRNRGLFAVAAIICAAVFVSCSRSVEELSVDPGESLYIRIVQVDKDGTKTYSKVVKAVKE